MSPIQVFYRTLLRSSAIFFGTAAMFLHPPLEWSSASHGGVVAQQSGSEARIDALVGALKDTDTGVRRQVANALAEIGTPRAVPALAAALKDTDADVRASVAAALGQIGDKSAVEALIGAAKDANATVRRRVIEALGEIGDS
ncbi:MAG: HEAT repeat domain-containing protein, partial [Gemmatimonadetes bacterium]|nr:HEAT repeat domain-containing protein [Gemmatimonadota bacterium]